MTKLRLLTALHNGEIGEAEALTALNIPRKSLARMKATWFPRLSRINETLAKLKEPATRKSDQTQIKQALALALGMSYRQINRILEDEQSKLPTPESIVQRIKNHQKAKQMREKALKKQEVTLKKLRNGQITVGNAADELNLSVRQIYRLRGQYV